MGIIGGTETTQKGQSGSVTFEFAGVPSTVDELKALPEASLDSPYKAAALAILSLFNFSGNEASMNEMLDFLNGPDDLSAYTKQFIKDRLRGKEYKVGSFFKGAAPGNGYTPTQPLTITVEANPYSFDCENAATMYVKSAGADSPRPLKLRKKPSTGQWFVVDIQCLADIRVPAELDPWA